MGEVREAVGAGQAFGKIPGDFQVEEMAAFEPLTGTKGQPESCAGC